MTTLETITDEFTGSVSTVELIWNSQHRFGFVVTTQGNDIAYNESSDDLDELQNWFAAEVAAVRKAAA